MEETPREARQGGARRGGGEEWGGGGVEKSSETIFSQLKTCWRRKRSSELR